MTFDKANKIYQPGETVTGNIVLKNFDTQMNYSSVELEAEAYMDTVSLIRGNLGRPALPKEKRIYFMQKKENVAQEGILFSGGDPLPFSFKLESVGENKLIDSYVGVDFSIVYKVMISMKRKGEAKPLEGQEKFACRVPGGGISPELGRRAKPQDYTITPDAMAVDPKSGGKVPRFNFCG